MKTLSEKQEERLQDEIYHLMKDFRKDGFDFVGRRPRNNNKYIELEFHEVYGEGVRFVVIDVDSLN